MKLIVGLGNPELKYEKTRHSTGFLAVDYIQKNIGAFSRWQLKKKLKAKISEGQLDKDTRIILAKPQTFMNNSGDAVKLLTSNLSAKGGSASGGQLLTSNLFVVHDDFDLLLGAFKVEKERGSAGHKGVQSIIDALGTNDFWRLRIGIRPANIDTNIKAEDYVLKNFSKEEMEIMQETIKEAAKILFPELVER